MSKIIVLMLFISCSIDVCGQEGDTTISKRQFQIMRKSNVQCNEFISKLIERSIFKDSIIAAYQMVFEEYIRKNSTFRLENFPGGGWVGASQNEGYLKPKKNLSHE